MDTDHTADAWRRAHETAARVRATLVRLGIPATEVTSITARRDVAGRDYVYLGSLPLDGIDRLLDALTAAHAEQTP
jgi:hypothetical protein